ncbi:uncharacterized protein SOCE26_035450 [Sorangium cellulosum]|uniref:Fatty acid hydroxylase domain-containing protein n=1 Tax=Sorangium cellulosum TaxID=56 RepID=A0A2L0ES19_SORCE|nr:hypothetical protein [Sorangium cellulosum]AUX42118.1 uncharacterized protein SOCE26_035450 [Sorangium cellulosum]
MEKADPAQFHQLYGVKRPRITYFKRDFIDYVLMTLITASIIWLTYGAGSWVTSLGLALCALMIPSFLVRHGVELRTPEILKRPQDLLYMLVYKLRNMKPVTQLALAILLLENLFIYLTPNLPHHVELTGKIAIYLFYIHFIGITVYRTVILFDHLRKKELVREVLLQTNWKKWLEKRPNVTLHILHAYATGVLTHIVFLAPWYLVITHAKFSVLALPVTLATNIFVQYKFTKIMNVWFYRDHWTSHNAELEFLYIHGTHHDAIPSGLIGVAGNGYMEGFLRFVFFWPTHLFNPILAAVLLTALLKSDIDSHQYIPGIFPSMSKAFHEVSQHSTHHYGFLEPYGFATKLNQPDLSEAGQEIAKKFKRALPVEVYDSVAVDEQLNGFKWSNSAHRRFMELVSRYQKH